MGERRRAMVSGVIAGLSLASAANADVVRDGTLGPDASLQPAGPDYLIPHTMGELDPDAQANLFHSFLDFSLDQAQSATFTGPTSVARILARVTGGSASTIDGLLSSQISGADLYLINPLGIVFGENARLDVSGSFHATTADAVALGADGLYSASAPAASVLTADPPSAFLFTGNGPIAPIEVNESLLAVDAGASLSLVGGDVTVRGMDHPEAGGRAANATLYAPGGRIGVVSVASQGQVHVAPDGAFSLAGFDALGDIDLSATAAQGPLEEGANTVLDVAGDPGGQVVIRGGRLTMSDGAIISAATLGDVDHPGVAVDIQLDGEMEMSGFTEIGVSSFAGGDAGDVSIRAGSLLMRGDPDSPAFGGQGSRANIGSRTFAATGGGDGGALDIEADLIRINELANLQTNTFGDGDTGEIRLTAETIEISSERGSAFVASNSAGTGDAGSVLIDTHDLLLDQRPGGGPTGISVQVRADAQGNPNGGVLRISATGTIRVLGGAQVNGAVFQGGGNGADIEISADSLIVSGVARDADGEYRIVPGPDFFPSGIFSSVMDFVGFGGTPATAGDIRLNAREIVVEEGAQITSLAQFPSAGNAGNIYIDTQTLRLENSGAIRNDSFGFGEGGLLSVRADEIVVQGPSLAPSFNGTGLFAQGGTAAQSSSAIAIDTGSLQLLAGGRIRTTTFGMAPGGPIEITAESILVSGIDPVAEDPRFPSGEPDTASEIISGSLVFLGFVDFSGGDGGRIAIDAHELQVIDGGRITARSQTAGTGGTIDLQLDRLVVGSNGEITVSSTQAGDAGDVVIDASDLTLLGGSILAEATQADGGNIVLFGERALLEDARVSAAVGGGDGRGGNIGLTADEFVVLERSSVSANAFEGPGGNVAVTTRAFIVDNRSTLSASSELGIDGTVAVNSPETDVEGAIVAPDVQFEDAGSLLQARCSVGLRTGSTLVVTRGDGLPASPDGFLSHGQDGTNAEIGRLVSVADPNFVPLAMLGCLQP